MYNNKSVDWFCLNKDQNIEIEKKRIEKAYLRIWLPEPALLVPVVVEIMLDDTGALDTTVCDSVLLFSWGTRVNSKFSFTSFFLIPWEKTVS